MGYRVEVTSAAATDSERIMDYLLNHLRSSQAALGFRHGVDKAIHLMESLPESLPACADARLRVCGYRRAMAGNYLMLYRVSERRAEIEDGEVVDHGEVGGIEGVVEVARIFHASEDYPDLI